MKKLLIASNVILLGIILFQVHSQINKPAAKRGQAAFYHPYDSCTGKFCKDYSNIPLQGVISGDLIQKMSIAYSRDPAKSKINYNNQHVPVLPNKRLQQDALSVCFDLEKIKNFIWHMEHAICIAGCDSSQQIGIRIYYIKYDTAGMPADLKHAIGSNLNKHSLVMVPAYKTGNEWHDFDYSKVEPGCAFTKIDISLSKFFSAGLISLGSGDNHGGIGPPPAPGTYPTN